MHVMATFSCTRMSPSITWLVTLLGQLAVASLAAGAGGRAASQAAILSYRVEEEKPPFTHVGNVRDDSHLRVTYQGDEDTLASLRFHLHHPTAAANEYFAIDSETGQLRTRSRIDRDALCRPAKPHCDVLHLDVVVKPYQYYEIIKVRIKVTDVNDLHPTFPKDRIEFRVLETAALGTRFPLPPAEDGDLGNNSVVIYDFAQDQPSSMFDLAIHNHSDGSITASLVLQQQLDHEQADFHRLKVIAYDGGRPPLSGSLLVDIIVLDANDNTPIFNSDVYEARVSENAQPGSEVIRLSATDADSGAYGEVSYALSPADAVEHGDTFRIDNRTGMVYVRGPLDYETLPFYKLTIEATDKGLNSKPTKTRLNIQVLDINDNAPDIRLNAMTLSGFAEIKENLNPGTFVAFITVNDPDSGSHGRFDCNIDSSFFVLERSANSNDYKLFSDATFDREKRDTYDVRLTCTDYGDRRQVADRTIRVKVTDDNDHTPQFSQPIYNILFGENNVEGQNILKLNASDEDSGKNGAIKFTIAARNTSTSSSSSIQQPDVDIDPVTGMVRALVAFDYEKRHVYEFVVTATDHGDSPRSSTALLRLEIMDANDESPVFTEATPYVFYIDENGPANYLIDMVSATDADSHPYNQITYSIEYDDVDTLSVGLFEVDAFTGRLYAKAPLDRERASQHTFRIIASNVGFPKVRTAADVIVYVNDENDNAPLVVFPSRYNRTLHVSPFAPQGTVVGRVDVRDPDFGYNGTLTFEVTNRPQQPLFDVNPTSGAILVVGDISAFDMHVFHLRILVTDNGVPPREAETDTELFITVNRSASTGGLAEAALMGGLLSIGQTEFVAILAVIVGILLTAVIIATVTCCLRGRRQARDKRRCQRAFVGGGGGDRGETDKFLTTSLNGQSKAGDKYTIVVNANGKSDLLRAEEAIVMQRCRSDSDFAPNGSFYANNDKIEGSVAGATLKRGRNGANGSNGTAANRLSAVPCLCNGHVPDIVLPLSHSGFSNKQAADVGKKLRIPAPHVVTGDTCHGDRDSESACSGCTDSGRGLSEEGDYCHASTPSAGSVRCPAVRETKSPCAMLTGVDRRSCCTADLDPSISQDARMRCSSPPGGGQLLLPQQPVLGCFTAHSLALGRLATIDRLDLGPKGSSQTLANNYSAKKEVRFYQPPTSTQLSAIKSNNSGPELDHWLQTTTFYSAAPGVNSPIRDSP